MPARAVVAAVSRRGRRSRRGAARLAFTDARTAVLPEFAAIRRISTGRARCNRLHHGRPPLGRPDRRCGCRWPCGQHAMPLRQHRGTVRRAVHETGRVPSLGSAEGDGDLDAVVGGLRRGRRWGEVGRRRRVEVPAGVGTVGGETSRVAAVGLHVIRRVRGWARKGERRDVRCIVSAR